MGEFGCTARTAPFIGIPREFFLEDTERGARGGYTKLWVERHDDEGVDAIFLYFFKCLFSEWIPVSHPNIGVDVESISVREGLFY